MQGYLLILIEIRMAYMVKHIVQRLWDVIFIQIFRKVQGARKCFCFKCKNYFFISLFIYLWENTSYKRSQRLNARFSQFQRINVLKSDFVEDGQFSWKLFLTNWKFILDLTVFYLFKAVESAYYGKVTN